MIAPTPAQQKIITRMAEGDYPELHFGGYFWADDPWKRVSVRSLRAMVKHQWLIAEMAYASGTLGAQVRLSQKALDWLDDIGFEHNY